MAQDKPFHQSFHAAFIAAIENQMDLKPLTITGRRVMPWVLPKPFRVNQGPCINVDFSGLEERLPFITKE